MAKLQWLPQATALRVVSDFLPSRTGLIPIRVIAKKFCNFSRNFFARSASPNPLLKPFHVERFVATVKIPEIS